MTGTIFLLYTPFFFWELNPILTKNISSFSIRLYNWKYKM
jgi:hypothetical protein